MYKQKAAYNDGMASRATRRRETRLREVRGGGPAGGEAAGSRTSRCGCAGGRTGKRAVVCEGLELTGLMKPFDLEVWYGERVAVLGSNGSGKSHFLRLLAGGGSDPDVEHRPVDDDRDRAGRAHRAGPARRAGAAGLVRPDPRRTPSWSAGPCWRSCAAATTTATGWGASRRSRALDRYELAHAAEQTFESLSGGQQARLQILLLELSGATLLLLDEPTDNLDLVSAEALEEGLAAFDGTVVARDPRPVVRPRRSTGSWSSAPTARVYEADEPVWDEGRVQRAR